MKRCNILCFVLLVGITLCGCQAKSEETKTNNQEAEQIIYLSLIHI